MSEMPPAGWYRDPSGRHEHRFWDGATWTDHVGSHGRQGVDPLPGPGASKDARASSESEPERSAAEVVAPITDAKTLMTEQVLVINQKAKLIGSTLAYAVLGHDGQRLGTIEELRRDLTTVVSDRLRGRTKESRAHRFQVVDTSGHVLLAISRPEMGWFVTKGHLVVEGAAGETLGQIAHESFGLGGGFATATKAGVNSASLLVQRGLGGFAGLVAGAATLGAQDRLNSAVEKLDKVGHARFGLEANGHRLGAIVAESVSKWDFQVLDTEGIEIAKITKTWAGWAKERFTKADNYVVEMHRPLEEPLRSLVIAGALAIDVELKERGAQTRGSSLMGTRRYK